MKKEGGQNAFAFCHTLFVLRQNGKVVWRAGLPAKDFGNFVL